MEDPSSSSEALAASSPSLLEGISFGVGTWAWGDKLFWNYGSGYTQEDLRQVFDSTLKSGIWMFDTAEVYGQGQSERMLGEFLKTTPQRVFVATKFMPYPWRLGRSSLIKALRGSLKRLGLERVDLYQVHQPLPPITPETWMTAMIEAYHAGLTRGVGVSNYDRSWMQRSHDTLLREGVPLASNQVEYNLLNRKVEKNGLLKQCQETHTTLIAYSPLAMGLLTGKYTLENPPRGIRGRRYAKLLQKLPVLVSLMNKIGMAHDGKTPAQVALNWCICKGTLPIPGAKTVKQADQNAGALGWKMTEDEVVALDEASDQVVA